MKKRIAYPKWHKKPELIEFIAEFERAHFRTETDTGADVGAMFLWNCVRHRVGLPFIGPEDLPKWDVHRGKYVLPKKSKLTGVSA